MNKYDIDGRRNLIFRKIMQRIKSCPGMCLDGQTVAVHRVIFTHFFGFIPGKKQIDHKCRNRLCCNPDHLELVTHKENQRRRDAAKLESEVA